MNENRSYGKILVDLVLAMDYDKAIDMISDGLVSFHLELLFETCSDDVFDKFVRCHGLDPQFLMSFSKNKNLRMDQLFAVLLAAKNLGPRLYEFIVLRIGYSILSSKKRIDVSIFFDHPDMCWAILGFVPKKLGADLIDKAKNSLKSGSPAFHRLLDVIAELHLQKLFEIATNDYKVALKYLKKFTEKQIAMLWEKYKSRKGFKENIVNSQYASSEMLSISFSAPRTTLWTPNELFKYLGHRNCSETLFMKIWNSYKIALPLNLKKTVIGLQKVPVPVVHEILEHYSKDIHFLTAYKSDLARHLGNSDIVDGYIAAAKMSA